MNGGEIITEVLLDYGVENLFTLSGGHIAPIYVEAEKAGIRVTDVRHEASAVFAADAIGRMSGIPGVAVVTAGPGVTNTITALKNAQLAQSPVVLLGGAAATLLKGRGALQDIDQLALVSPHVKYAGRVDQLRLLRPMLHTAFKTALSGVPGPVFLECPMDLLYNESMVRDLYNKNISKKKSLNAKLKNWYIRRHVNRLFKPSKSDEKYHLYNPLKDWKVSAKKINSVWKTIQSAERPVLLVGSGAMQLPVKADHLSISINNLGIPVFLSGMARGLLGKSNLNQFYHQRTKALRSADCVVLAGVPCDFRLNYGQHFQKSAKKIAISRFDEELRKNIRPNLLIQTDPGLFLIELAKSVDKQNSNWSSWFKTLQESESDRESFINDMSQQEVDFINPLALLKKMDEVLPDKSVIIVDGGDFAASASYILRPRSALKWLDPGVFGTLGSGGGFALGAALLYPDHYIWIIYGDGSCAYSLTEFDTFRKFGMKVCGIIGNNGSWEQIARDQIHILGSDTASTLPRSDYELIAHAFGAGGEKVQNLPSFENALKTSIKSMDKNIPTIINALIGSTEFRKGSMSM